MKSPRRATDRFGPSFAHFPRPRQTRTHPAHRREASLSHSRPTSRTSAVSEPCSGAPQSELPGASAASRTELPPSPNSPSMAQKTQKCSGNNLEREADLAPDGSVFLQPVLAFDNPASRGASVRCSSGRVLRELIRNQEAELQFSPAAKPGCTASPELNSPT